MLQERERAEVTCLLRSEVVVPRGEIDVRRTVDALAVDVEPEALGAQNEHTHVRRRTEVDVFEHSVPRQLFQRLLYARCDHTKHGPITQTGNVCRQVLLPIGPHRVRGPMTSEKKPIVNVHSFVQSLELNKNEVQ